MDQDTPDSDRSDDDESKSASGTENEDSSGKSPDYRLQRVELETLQGEAIASYVEENEVKLNVEQLQVYEEVLRSVNNEEDKICFLDVLGGTKKSFLINLLLSKVGGQQSVAIAAASL